MVGLNGLEPSTSTMSTWHSNQLSYNPKRLLIIHKLFCFCKLFFRLRLMIVFFDSAFAFSPFHRNIFAFRPTRDIMKKCERWIRSFIP